MDNYFKSISLKFDIDNSSIKDFDKTINDVVDDSLKTSLKKYKTLTDEIADFREQIAALQNLNTDEANQAIEQLKTEIELRQRELGLTTDRSLERGAIVDDSLREASAVLDEVISDSLDKSLKKYDILTDEISTFQQQISRLQNIGTKEAKEAIKQFEHEIDIRQKELGVDSNNRMAVVEKLSNVLETTGAHLSSFGKKISGETVLSQSFGKAAGDIGEVLTGFSSGFEEGLLNVGSMFLDGLTSLVSGALDEMENILESSQMSSSQTRELMLTYGFSQSQAYGYTKALETVGLSDLEDLVWASTQEQQQFYKAFTKYSQKYDSLYDSGFFQDLQDYNYEIASLKEDLQLEVVQFFVDNKDLIKSGMTGILTISKTLLEIASSFNRAFGGTGQTLSTTELVNQYKTTSNNTSVTFHNNYNGVSKNDEAWLSNAGEMQYEQFIRAIQNR